MPELPSSFNTIELIVLDMDGVITSEESYWDTAGLVIQDLLESPAFLGVNPSHYLPIADLFYQRLIKGHRHEWRKYLPPELILHIKTRGINSNWDLAYLAAGLYLAPLFREPLEIIQRVIETPNDADAQTLQEFQTLQASLEPVWKSIEKKAKAGEWENILCMEHFYLWGEYFRGRKVTISPQKNVELQLMDDFHPSLRGLQLLDELNRLLGSAFHARHPAFGRSSQLWQDCRDLFQQWYLGSELYEELYKKPLLYKQKPGLIHGEEPLHSLARTHACLASLKKAGYRLGVATGRPLREIMTPLQEWDMLKYFDEDRIAAYDHIEQAEKILRNKNIHQKVGKPHPYVFLRSIYPNADTVELATTESHIDHPEKVLIVGDAQADLWAAQKIGCPCAALLSGAIGPAARKQLEEANPDVIFHDILELSELLVQLKKPR